MRLLFVFRYGALGSEVPGQRRQFDAFRARVRRLGNADDRDVARLHMDGVERRALDLDYFG